MKSEAWKKRPGERPGLAKEVWRRYLLKISAFLSSVFREKWSLVS
jgi:hypothetical protein